MKISKFLVVALMLLLVTTAPAFASSDDLPSPGLTPDSPFYSLEVLWEKILISLTFDPEKKANLIAEIAGEKVAEAMEMVEENKAEAAQVSLQLYENYLQEVLEIINTSEPANDLTGLNEKLQQVTQKHLEVLETLSSNAPDSLKEALKETKELVEESFETLVEVSKDEQEDDEMEELEAHHEEEEEEKSAEVEEEEHEEYISGEESEYQKQGEKEEDKHSTIHVDEDEDHDKNVVKDKDEDEVKDVKSDDDHSPDVEEDEDD
jgi:hypothetical protein